MIAYKLSDSLYLNVTNRCTNDCCFCLRNIKPSVVGYDLWLDEEPSLEDVIQAIGDPTPYREVVFCGYGEPLTRLELVKKVCEYIKEYGVKTRIDTNGQANLIYKRNIVPELKGLVDGVSISLNAENAEKYNKICRSRFGEKAFDGVIDFARQCVKHIPEVVLTVVALPDVNVDKCREIAARLGASFRVRPLVEHNKEDNK